MLTPMNRGANRRPQAEPGTAAGPESPGRRPSNGAASFPLNDKVMQIRNNYDKDVFNGDLGRIRKIDTENQEIECRGGRTVSPMIFPNWMNWCWLMRSRSIRLRGANIRPWSFRCSTQHYVMLQRNLLYTAMTRARKLVVIVGSKKALAIAVRQQPDPEALYAA